jgi:hypothetical protein
LEFQERKNIIYLPVLVPVKQNLVVEQQVKTFNGFKLQLPTLVECDHIPSDEGEISTPEQVKQFPHLRDIAEEIPPVDENARIHLLFGRDAPRLVKVKAFRNGPRGTPWGHKLSLGSTIIGQVCLDRQDGPVHITTERTFIRDPPREKDTFLPRPKSMNTSANENAKPQWQPCLNKFVVKEAYKDIEKTVSVSVSMSSTQPAMTMIQVYL